MLTRFILPRLEASIAKTSDRISHLAVYCKRHEEYEDPEADACPCQVRLYWKLDRLDESIHRLKNKRQWALRWWIWYIRSSPRCPGFPKQSIDCWSQTNQPIAAWEKYSVPRRNSSASRDEARAYIYYANSRERSTRPVAAMNSE
jgi:hypothetical protein